MVGIPTTEQKYTNHKNQYVVDKHICLIYSDNNVRNVG